MTANNRRDEPFSVLLVCRSYPPVLGGSEIEAQRVSAALLARGHRVTVLCAGGPPMPEVSRWIDPAGVPVRLFGRRWPARFRDYAFACGVVWTLLRERKRYQIVYFLMQGIHLAAGLPAARWLRKPIVMKISGSNLITLMTQSWLGRLELRWLRQWASRVMVLNSAMAEEARAAGFAPGRILWMPNPVSTEEFAPCSEDSRRRLRAAMGVPEGAQIVVYAGRLAPEKELHSLLQAFALVAQRVPGALLVLIGDGPERRALEEPAGRLGCDAPVRFTGRQTLTTVRQWLQISDVFALVSSLEGFPCSLIEAMSVALPCVVSNIPANTQLIDDRVHGLHAMLRDPASIADALTKLLTEEPLRVRMGAAGRQRVLDNYSVEKVLARYEALFRETLAAGAAA